MLPPPSPPPAGQPAGQDKQRAGLAVLVVALVTLLGLVALVWWVNEQDDGDDPFGSGAAPPAAVAGQWGGGRGFGPPPR